MKQERLSGTPLPLVTIDLEEFNEGPLAEVLPQLNFKLHEDIRRGFQIHTVGLREDVVADMVAAGLLDKEEIEPDDTNSPSFELRLKGLMPKWNIRILKSQPEEVAVSQFTTFDKNNEAIVY